MKKIIILFVAIFMAGLFAMDAGSAERLKFSHHRPVGSPLDSYVKELAKKIEKETDGRVVFDLFPAGQLGDYAVVQERISLGDVACHIGPLSMITDKKLGISWFPYLCINWEEAKLLYGKGGVVREMLAERLARQNLTLVGTWPAMLGGVGLTRAAKDMKNPFTPKGLKVRIMANKVYEYVFDEVLGYKSTAMPWGELFTAMQTGVIDGVHGAGAESYYSQFRDVLKFYLAYNDHYESFYFLMNTDVWKGLSKKDRDVITKISDSMEAERWKQAPKDEEIYRKKLAEAGVKTIVYSDTDLAKIKKLVVEKCWPKAYGEVPKEMLDKALEALRKGSIKQ